ncbi:PBSX family phage terminase large subunit [Metabacillus fastidiosus]|uniref:PBSX family phage terminase large subunit n=1 Tax=Metabacillus fastidiosus TaxID=1458 RepID=UPI002E1F3005|nr:PBSX family phage terminase large subunit [Metabacillus fastidiosus]
MEKTINPVELFPPKFRSFLKASKKQEYLYYVNKGGRGSGKSSDVALDIILDMMEKPINALAVRKVDNTLEGSVFSQLIWAIEQLEVSHLWRTNQSPLKLTFIPRGNYILFRGAQDPARIKSIKSPKFPLTLLWIEELAEFKTEDEVTTIINSILRGKLEGGLKYKVHFSYNPPKRKQSWVNKRFETAMLPANTFVLHSDYRDNPYIADEFLEEAEEAKKRNEFKYRWEYLGEPIGSGIVPFSNLEFRKITDDEIRRFDNIKQGLDWGYSVDPLAFIRCHYDRKRRTLYLIDELYEVKISNRKAAEWIKKKGYTDSKIICDSAEPKSIDELENEHRIYRVEGAEKGPGSVEHGEKWLDDLEAIVIDPSRTPNAAKEFENIDYQTDKDGNPKAKLEDKDNHIIDAVRYALEDEMVRRIAYISSQSAW